MTSVLIHDMPQRARDLEQRLRNALRQLPSVAQELLDARLILEEHEVPRLVLTGQFSSGKSTLIKALTDGAADVTIDADIATDRVTEYDWDGHVVLVDTPGVKAGVERHDELAEDALARADLVLFVVTVDLFDEAGAAHLRHVSDQLGKRDQLLVVVSKSGSMSAAPGIRERAVADAAGPGPALPLVECDAADYLTSLGHHDMRRSAAYRVSSGIDRLRAEINALSERRGTLAIHRQPFQLLKSIVMEAQAAVVDDPTEQAALALLARQRMALATRRQRIETQLAALRGAFMRRSLAAAETFADGVDAVDSLPDGPDRNARIASLSDQLREDLNAAATALGADVERMIELQYSDLAGEVREIESGPHARLVLDLVEPGMQHGSLADAGPSRPSGLHQVTVGDTNLSPWLTQTGRWLKDFQKFWGAGGGLKTSAGSTGHKVVLDVGHAFGKKFKPWEAVKVANRLGQVAKVGGAVLVVAGETAGVLLEERARVAFEKARIRRRAGLVDEVSRQAEQIATDSLTQVRDLVDPSFRSAYARIDEVHREIIAARAGRSELAQELTSIQEDCDRALAQLPVA
jgi:signal recognition particle receptor subunit beta